MRKILFLVSEDWYFYSHRLPVARAEKRLGFEVTVVTRVNRHADRIAAEGFRLVPLHMERSGKNPVKDLGVIRQLVGIYRSERPDIVHHVAMKPVLYGSIAARLAGVPHVVNALAGLGYLFISGEFQARFLRRLVTTAFRFLFGSPGFRLILQNPDDLALFVRSGLVPADKVVLIRGSGVDPIEFAPHQPPDGVPVVMLASRMIWDKGVGEFVEAAAVLHERGVKARFVLVGDSDLQNPHAVSRSALEEWSREGVIEWWGTRDNMPQVFAAVSIVCLPSAYGEGIPKVLIEGASCGLPIVTTDSPGCREIVRDGENGLLVPVRDARSLADALRRLIESPELRERMGRRGREMVLQHFSIETVVAQTMELYESLLSGGGGRRTAY